MARALCPINASWVQVHESTSEKIGGKATYQPPHPNPKEMRALYIGYICKTW